MSHQQVLLRKLINAPKRPTITVLCGSTRFMQAFHDANAELTAAGHIVLTVAIPSSEAAGGELDPELKYRLDELHRRKIDLADEVYVLNVGGYIGESTANEIAYATQEGKPIRYLEEKAA